MKIFTTDAITFRRCALIYVTDDFDFCMCIYHAIDRKTVFMFLKIPPIRMKKDTSSVYLHIIFVTSIYKNLYTIGQFTAMPAEPYGAPLGPVIHPFSTNPRI